MESNRKSINYCHCGAFCSMCGGPGRTFLPNMRIPCPWPTESRDEAVYCDGCPRLSKWCSQCGKDLDRFRQKGAEAARPYDVAESLKWLSLNGSIPTGGESLPAAIAFIEMPD